MSGKLIRVALLVSAACAGFSVAHAQSKDVPIGTRVEKLEKEMRAVQRKVFPGGAGMTLEPEIAPPAPVAAGIPASNPLADLSSRVDSLEKQISTLTGQVEQQGYRLKKLEDALPAQQAANAAATPPVVALPAPPVAIPIKPGAAPSAPLSAAPVGRAPTGDPAEDGYLAGYDLWEAKNYAGAQKLLSDVATKYPKHRRYSYAQNLLGRAYLDEGKPVTAAKVFLENYRTAPQGERAADSLYFLGVTLIQLKKLPDACKSFDELQVVYGATLRDYLKERLPVARKEAQCAAK